MTFRPLLAAFGLLGAASASLSLAQAPASSAPSSPYAGLVRSLIEFDGTVASTSGNSFVVHSQQRGDVKLTFPDPPMMVSLKVTVADLAAGKFVGCTAVKGADNLLHATECHIFPEFMRSAGEGHNPMEPPNTTMITGNVASATGGDSATINISYKGGQQSIQVGPDTNITRMDGGNPAIVKPGSRINGVAKTAADGSNQLLFIDLAP